MTHAKLTIDKFFEMMDHSCRCDGYGNVKTDHKKLVKKINEFFKVKK